MEVTADTKGLEPDGTVQGFYLIDVMSRRYSNPHQIIGSLSWKRIPEFVRSMIRAEQEELIFEIWKDKVDGQEYNEFKDRVIGKVNSHVTNTQRDDKQKVIQKGEEMSGWEFKTIEE